MNPPKKKKKKKPATKKSTKKTTKKTTRKKARKKTPKKPAKKATARKKTAKTKKTRTKAAEKKTTKKKATKKKPAKARKKARRKRTPYPRSQSAGRTVDESFDVVVVGGGLAGICAAIAAARGGCRTALVHDRPVLGGNSSSEVRVPPGGANNCNAWARETGIIEELMLDDRARNHEPVASGTMGATWDLGLYQAVQAEPRLTVHLDTSARGVEMASSRRIGAVLAVQAGSERAYRFEAPLVIDCTGDGTVGAAAGATFRYGREAREEFDEPLAPPEADNKTQGSSLMFRSCDAGRPVPFAPPPWAVLYPTAESLAGRRPAPRPDGSYAGYWWIEIGVPYHIVDDNAAIRHEALRHLMGVWDHIKNRGDHGAETLALDWVATVPGKRESRRLEGDYILRQHDLYHRARFPDRVAYGGWFIDIHTMGGILAAAEGLPPEALNGDPDRSDDLRVPLYSIPYRCLYSKNIGNLMMAGRNISVSHVALGSTRLMLTCALLGQAAGTAAAMAVRHGISPRQVGRDHIVPLQQQLLRDGCFIPGLRNQDAADLALGAMAEAASEAQLDLEPVLDHADLARDYAQILPLSAARLDTLSLLLRWEGEEALELPIELAPVADIWSFNDPPLGEPLAATATVPPGHQGWVDFPFQARIEPGLYRIAVPAREGLAWARSTALPGVAAASKKPSWRRYATERGVNAVRLDPPSAPFGPESVVNGVARPERWPNLWLSRPLQGSPQALTLDLGSDRTFDTVHLTFDTMLHLDHRAFPPLHGVPQCVRHYAVQVEREGAWETVAEVADNVQYRRVHAFEPLRARRLRIEVRATNGAPEARLYELRVYSRA
ncbi:MAG: FAD-dependent oxidoreductase [Candidatus Brocadiia bacterium]